MGAVTCALMADDTAWALGRRLCCLTYQADMKDKPQTVRERKKAPREKIEAVAVEERNEADGDRYDSDRREGEGEERVDGGGKSRREWF